MAFLVTGMHPTSSRRPSTRHSVSPACGRRRHHTVYSSRHTFKDRLIALEVPQRIQDKLMGHALHEIADGSGSTLKHRADWLARVWG